METLIAYLNALSKPERADFARRCGTSEGYLRKASSTGQQLGEGLCIHIDRESGGRVRCESLRTDVDWDYLRTRDVNQVPELAERSNGEASHV